MHPIRPASRAWDKISCDLITSLPETKSGYTAIYVVVDTLTKMVHFIPTTSDVNTEQLARLFVREVWRLHGLPKEIISDRDPRFTGNFARAVCKIIGTKQSMSTAYHPESDGQTERVNRVLEDVLRHYVSPDQNDWDEHLPFAEFAINNALHKSVQNTPFMLNYGQHPDTPIQLVIAQHHKVPAAQDFVKQIRDGIARARECLISAQNRYAAYANQSRQHVTFKAGDWVMLHTKNIHMQGTRKLLPRWLGPFQISDVVNPVAYRLALPTALRRMHNVFHVGLLKAYHSDVARSTFRPFVPKLSDEQGPIFEVERILDHRDVEHKQSGKGRITRNSVVREYLVQWQGYPVEDASWEPASNLLNASDKAFSTYQKSIGKVLLFFK